MSTDLRPSASARPSASTWPSGELEARPERRDWRDTVRAATDLALLGMLVTAAALPVVTAGAAVATGSAAVHHFLEYDRWPGPRALWTVFRRRLLSGFLATLGCAAAALLVVVDLLALRKGLVPGGVPLMLLTLAAAAAGAGCLGLLVVAIGSGRRFRIGGPARVASAAGLVSVAAVLAVFIHPVLVAVLLGYVLFALHVVARRPVHDRD
jgi:hypothetical protein